MAASIQERLKLKRLTVDVWSTREKLALAWAVQRSGDQNWSCVSRTIKPFAEKYRPADWFSPKNCAQQYAALLENAETPKRKKRSTGSTDRTEVETPGEYIVRVLNDQHIKDLEDVIIKNQQAYLKGLDELNAFVNGELDHMIPQYLEEIEERKKKEERKEKARADWLRDREKKKRDLESKLKPRPLLTPLRRESSLSEPSSDADSPFNEPLAVEVQDEVPKTVTPAPVPQPTPTSPLLTSLLKSPAGSTVSAGSSILAPPPSSPATSILHSAITSPLRGVSPTIASLLNSSPVGHGSAIVLPPGSVSPNLKSLVSSALGSREEPKPQPAYPPSTPSPSQGAPTLSMLLELPPSLPGKPLPVLQTPSTPPAPPPYTDHLGPPPPYSLATEYLQKQRAEQAAYQAQIAIRNVEKELMLAAAGATSAPMPPTFPTIQGHSSEPIDLDDIEAVIADETRKFKTDHDYMEPEQPKLEVPVPVVAVTPAPVPEETKVEMVKAPPSSAPPPQQQQQLDVFEFGEDEDTESITGISYAKSNAKRLARKLTSPSSPRAPPATATSPPPDQSEPISAEDDTATIDTDTSTIVEDKGDVELVEEVVEASVGEVVVSDLGDGEIVLDQNQLVEIKEEDIKTEEVPEISEETFKRRKSATPVKEEVVGLEPPALDDEKSNETATSSASLGAAVASAATTFSPAGLRRRRGTATTSDSIPNSPVSFNEEEKEYRAWKKSILIVQSRIEGHKSASLFLKPITDEHAPSYSSIVRRPMDLNTIKRNVEAGLIRSTIEFQRDVMLMFLNARMFNKTNDVIYQQTMIMQEDSLKHIQLMMESRGEAEVSEPARRETRTQDKSQPTRASRSSIKPALKRQRLSSDGPRKKPHLEET